jgi:hypothetical protein
MFLQGIYECAVEKVDQVVFGLRNMQHIFLIIGDNLLIDIKDDKDFIVNKVNTLSNNGLGLHRTCFVHSQANLRLFKETCTKNTVHIPLGVIKNPIQQQEI